MSHADVMTTMRYVDVSEGALPRQVPADSTNRRDAATAAILMLIASMWVRRFALART
jgi:hypothetical protein